MRVRTVPAVLLMVALLAPATAFAQRRSPNGELQAAAAPLPPIKYTEFKLKNGLRVILHEDHSTPIVGVNLWYHVGSKNEVPGKTGYAHLFEHMMFQGSKNYDDDFFKPIQEAGGTLNGSTNPDRTNYFEVVPSNFLELALFMEADRMGGYLDPAKMAILVVGDRKVIEPGLRSLEAVGTTITFVDMEGKPVAVSGGADGSNSPR